MKSPLQVLRDAREWLTPPGRWLQGRSGDDACRCLTAAVYVAAGQDLYLANRACEIVALHVGAVVRLYLWNDAPGRTHAEVLGALDGAIAGLERSESHADR